MKSVRIELTARDHHALRVAAATAGLTMREFAAAALLRAIRGADHSLPCGPKVTTPVSAPADGRG